MDNTNHIIEKMKIQHSWLVERMVDFRIDTFHPYEAIITLSNGAVWLYDCVEDSVRKLPPSEQTMSKEETASEFGKRLKKLMWKKGMTQTDLSYATGIAQAILSGYVNGKHEPGLYALDRIAKALDCSVDEFRYI